MNEITLRATFGATAAPGVTPVGQYTEPVRVAGPTLMVQVIGVGASVTVQGSNLPGVAGAWVDVATVATGVPEQVECLYGYVRVGASAPCEVGVSGVHGTASAGGAGATVGLTDAELRAEPVSVAMPGGLATEATLVAGAVSRWDQVALVSSDEATAGTVYLLYRPSKAGTGLVWGVKRVITAGASTEIRYAGPSNNPAVTDPWASRPTLVYGLPQEA